MENAPVPVPHPIPSVMQGVEYRPGAFWAARIASVAAVVALLWLFHNFVVPKLGIYDVRLLVLALLFATLAVSLNLINGVTGQFSIGHAAFYLIGAITAAKISSVYFHGTPTPNHQPQVWLILMVLAGGIASALAGLLVGLPSLRLRGDYLAVATLGFGEIVNVFLRNQDGKSQAVTATAVAGVIVASAVLYGYIKLAKWFPSPAAGWGVLVGTLKFLIALVVMRLGFLAVASTFGGFLDQYGRLDTGGAYGLVGVPKLTQIYFIILLFIGTVAISRNLLKSAHGLAFLAVREDELAADATGVSTTRVKVTAFAIGAAIAGMAGALFAHYQGTVSPDDFKMDVSFMLVAMVVIGGTGSITGAALAGIGLKLLEEGLRKLPPILAIDLFSLILAAIVVFLIYQYATRRGWLRLDKTLFVPFLIVGIAACAGLAYFGYLTCSANLSWVLKVGILALFAGALFGMIFTSARNSSLPKYGLFIPFLVLGLVACAGLAYLGYLTFSANLSWVLKVGIFTLFAGALFGMIFTRARNSALPRFGLLAFSLVIIKYAAPYIASVMHSISGIEKLIGTTTYNPSDLRWAVFSIALVFVMILRSQGLLGHHEFSWTFVRSLFGRRMEVVPT